MNREINLSSNLEVIVMRDLNKCTVAIGGLLLIFSGVANSQQRVMCPVPMHINLMAPNPVVATPLIADFSSVSAAVEPNFGGTTINRHFRHTFKWKPKTKCCQYLRGTLTLKYKALSGGRSNRSSDAGNDKWNIYKGGTRLAGGSMYTNFPFPVGTTGTKTIPLTPAMLAGNRLSFFVQDDTSITSAKLTLSACCIKNLSR